MGGRGSGVGVRQSWNQACIEDRIELGWRVTDAWKERGWICTRCVIIADAFQRNGNLRQFIRDFQ